MRQASRPTSASAKQSRNTSSSVPTSPSRTPTPRTTPSCIRSARFRSGPSELADSCRPVSRVDRCVRPGADQRRRRTRQARTSTVASSPGSFLPFRAKEGRWRHARDARGRSRAGLSRWLTRVSACLDRLPVHASNRSRPWRCRRPANRGRDRADLVAALRKLQQSGVPRLRWPEQRRSGSDSSAPTALPLVTCGILPWGACGVWRGSARQQRREGEADAGTGEHQKDRRSRA
jgi:hypothetical protein